jgi:hypothetical protein
VADDASNLDDLFERPWRTGRPYLPRVHRRRQIIMLAFLVVMLCLIGAYWHLTDPARVRRMAQEYLSTMVGGRVDIRRASLSVFEGLRLDGVTVRVDEDPRIDSVVFTAQTLLVKYNPGSILGGQLQATEIVALDPRVRLCEDVSRGERAWNWQRLGAPAGQPATTRPDAAPPVIPQIYLRGGQVDYARLVGGRYEPLGSLAIEGQFVPTGEPHRYRLEMESRGLGDPVGPSIRGVIDLGRRQADARLRSFDFHGAIKNMLPKAVGDWLGAHDLSGRIDVPVFHYAAAPGEARFRIETDLENVSLAFSRREMLTDAELREQDDVLSRCQRWRDAGFDPAGAMDVVEEVWSGAGVRLGWVTGKLIFSRTDEGDSIEIVDVRGRAEENSFQISGRIEGFAPRAPARITVTSKGIYIPPHPHYLSSLPPEAQRIYNLIRASGSAKLTMQLRRTDGQTPVRASGLIEVARGGMTYHLFPYPLTNVGGRIHFGFDESRRKDWVAIDDLRGQGLARANSGATFTINGFVSPLDSTNRVALDVFGQNVTLDEGIFQALDEKTRASLRMFAPPGQSYPHLFGDVLCKAHRPEGAVEDFVADVDLYLKDCAGAYRGFPYPLEHVYGTLRARRGYIEVDRVGMKRRGAELLLWGRVEVPTDAPARPALEVTLRNLAIDDDLLGALGEEERGAIKGIGLTGRIDLEGKLTTLKAARPATTQSAQTGGLDFDYDIRATLRDASLLVVDSRPAITDVRATIEAAEGGVTISSFSGRRGEGSIQGSGTIRGPSLSLSAQARGIPLDATLMGLLPLEIKDLWEQLQPQGAVDADVTYSGRLDKTAGTGPPGFGVVLRPRNVALKPKGLPLAISDLAGEITVSPGRIALKDLTARHGQAKLRLGGTLDTSQGAWDLWASAAGVRIDDQFVQGLPPAVASIVDALKLRGLATIELTKLVRRPPTPDTAQTRPSSSPQIDFAARIALAEASMDVGIPLAAIQGSIEVTGRIADDRLSEVQGRLELASLTIAGRPARNFRCNLLKPPDREAVQLSRIQAQLCGGELTGQVEAEWPQDNRPGRYALLVMLNNADVRQLVDEPAKTAQGRLSASLGIEGRWNDPASRRGGGDVRLAGKDLYHIPLVLGLFQITSLAMPISSPFDQAVARYEVDAQRVVFRRIELQAGTMLMQGTGSLDFGNRKVKMTFVTASPAEWKIPLLDPLLAGARRELLQIHVSGTVQEPKVSASSLSTFTTTIDEVFRGGSPSTRPAPK